jgi:hypothetical protein
MSRRLVGADDLFCTQTPSPIIDFWTFNTNDSRRLVFSGQGTTRSYYRHLNGTIDKLTGQVRMTVKVSPQSDQSRILKITHFEGIFTDSKHLKLETKSHFGSITKTIFTLKKGVVAQAFSTQSTKSLKKCAMTWLRYVREDFCYPSDCSEDMDYLCGKFRGKLLVASPGGPKKNAQQLAQYQVCHIYLRRIAFFNVMYVAVFFFSRRLCVHSTQPDAGFMTRAMCV